MSRPRNVLALSSFSSLNRVFEDYCYGIEANSAHYHFIDYVRAYLELGAAGLEQRILETIAAEEIDTVFFVLWSSDMTFSLDFIERLASRVKIVMNFFDTEYFFESTDRYYAQLADMVVLPDHLARFRFEHLGVPAHTSFALFDARYYRKLDRAKDIDVSFVGNLLQADRRSYIEFLRDNGIRVEAFGVGSENGFVSFEQMVEVFNRSRINLNFTSTSNSQNYVVRVPPINQRIRQSKGRPIEIALCGGFILSQHAPGIEHMFELGSEFSVFHNKQELLEIVRARLAEADETEAMAGRAHQRALNEYDVIRGFKTVFDRLETSSRNAELPVYRDREFMRGYSAHRFFYMANFLLGGRIGLAAREFGLVLKSGTLPIAMAYFSAIKGLTHFVRRSEKATVMLKSVRDRLGLKVKY